MKKNITRFVITTAIAGSIALVALGATGASASGTVAANKCTITTGSHAMCLGLGDGSVHF